MSDQSSEQTLDQFEPGLGKVRVDFGTRDGASLAIAWSRLTPDKDSEATRIRIIVLRPFSF